MVLNSWIWTTLICMSSPGLQEPIGEFSLKAADRYLAEASGKWVQTYNCVSCHTNGLYLLTGAMEPAGEPWREARAFALEYLDRYISEELEPRGQYGAVEGMVAAACFLALGDSVRFGTFTPEVQRALDHALSLQDESGHWPDWLACNWPPYESDHHFGVTLMALTLGRAPEEYRQKDTVKTAQAALQTWLSKNPPQNLHQKGMLLWAHAENGITLSPDVLADYRNELLSKQEEDGGWCMASLGDWPRSDGSSQLDVSEAYPTAFAIWILSRSGHDDQEVIDRAVDWLKANQGESGRWFSRSQRKDKMHYLSEAATNMASIAIRASAPRSDRSKSDIGRTLRNQVDVEGTTQGQ